ncbi:MAG: hypothetical protein ACJA06_002474 [Halocynthiibacter sp.]|jgi:uncharacterized protein (DUF1330 family)
MAADWRAILALEEAHLRILNLLSFRPAVEIETGVISGQEAYGLYRKGTSGAFLRCGGESLAYGKASHVFGMNTDTDWDAMIMTRYPSPRALASMWLDPEFLRAHKHRESGIERSCVLVLPGA